MKPVTDVFFQQDQVTYFLLKNQMINNCIDLFCQNHRLYRAKHKEIEQ